MGSVQPYFVFLGLLGPLLGRSGKRPQRVRDHRRVRDRGVRVQAEVSDARCSPGPRRRDPGEGRVDRARFAGAAVPPGSSCLQTSRRTVYRTAGLQAGGSGPGSIRRQSLQGRPRGPAAAGPGAAARRRTLGAVTADQRKAYRSRKWQRAREAVLNRCGGRCELCGERARRNTVHHRQPINHGGAMFDGGNLIAVCEVCMALGRSRSPGWVRAIRRRRRPGAWRSHGVV